MGLAVAAPASSPRPPLLFIHGSYHAAWCWQENFMPYFAARGYDTYAVSMRAQGGSDPATPGSAVAGTLDQHTADLASLVPGLQSPGGPAPVLLGHSFGGMFVHKYVLAMAPPGALSTSATPGSFPPISGAALMCSVPHTGNKQLVMRFLMRDPIFSFKLTWGFVARSFARSKEAARELFFSKDIPDDRLDRRCVFVSASASAPSAAAYATKHTLPDGKKLELLVHKATAPASSPRPPLLFIHGSYHAAWCWQENFMPYFAARGYDTYAVSMRAQGGSDPATPGSAVAGTLDQHTADLASLVPGLQSPGGPAPVLLGHSFGGMFVHKYARELFFSKDIPDDRLDRYQKLLAAASPTRMIDLKDMNAQVPLPPPPPHAPPAFVLGGANDMVVDKEAVEDTRWELAARELEAWLAKL
ncbi:hypothetical protein GPECTOR_464g376 [Gonium pectorale]|uniref:AB hydrolase-1 domain-containing protein n=1 Tax=Gonium pectorale TaxID=33097 RepID=A0A150FV04_GONPE|nr:hypothetical protein GPECTOR_464g376 [Gonium pectorale]|eukprot:KXZ41444.1 hypothetical protein GPECTOR_464g376 [Gonium pectorale]